MTLKIITVFFIFLFNLVGVSLQAQLPELMQGQEFKALEKTLQLMLQAETSDVEYYDLKLAQQLPYVVEQVKKMNPIFYEQTLTFLAAALHVEGVTLSEIIENYLKHYNLSVEPLSEGMLAVTLLYAVMTAIERDDVSLLSAEKIAEEMVDRYKRIASLINETLAKRLNEIPKKKSWYSNKWALLLLLGMVCGTGYYYKDNIAACIATLKEYWSILKITCAIFLGLAVAERCKSAAEKPVPTEKQAEQPAEKPSEKQAENVQPTAHVNPAAKVQPAAEVSNAVLKVVCGTAALATVVIVGPMIVKEILPILVNNIAPIVEQLTSSTLAAVIV